MTDQEENKKFRPQVSDEAVKAKTGKTWGEWFDLLDEAGAREMNHKEIVAHLHEHHSVKPWWQQMVTVTYEQARGLREKHQQSGGYQVSANKTYPVALEELFEAWNAEARRTEWLGDQELTIRKATPNKSMRIAWGDGSSKVDVYFTSKGDNKSQVSVQHAQLDSAEAGERQKEFWREALKRLAEKLAA